MWSSCRFLLTLTIVATLLAVGGVFHAASYKKVLKKIGVRCEKLCFADLRTITGAGESLADGCDPMVKNPGDPWGRTMNYPRVWLLPARLGMSSEDTPLLAEAFILLFLATFVLLVGVIEWRWVPYYLFAVVSPAVLLGIERGNNDLFIFFLLGLAAFLYGRLRWSVAATWILVCAGFVLKLYPLFAVAVFLGETRRGFIKAASLLGIAAAVYIAFTYADLQLIKSGTQYDYVSSYGMNVLPLWLGKFGWSAGWVGGMPFVCFLVYLSYYILRRNRRLSVRCEGRDSQMAAFRIGSAIFIGTYLLGSNWDYRLMFLLLTIPQLNAWIKEDSGAKRISRVALGCLMLMLWNAMFYKIVSDNAAFILDEAISWILLSILGRLLVLSLPAWALVSGCGASHKNSEEVDREG